MVQGEPGDELTTFATKSDGRSIEVLRGGTVRERPTSAMFLTKRPFPGLQPSALLLCAQPRSPRSELFRPLMTRVRGSQQEKVQPWHPAAPRNLDDAW